MSGLFKEMCELLEIGKTRTTSYRPSANGQVERYNRSIAQIIRCCIGNRQESWDDFVGISVGAIRATVNRSTGFTPNRMMLGREVMMPLDLMLGSDGEEAKIGGTFRADFKDGWVEAHQKAREILEGVQKTPPARGGTAQKKIIHLANWSQLIHPGPASSLTKVFLVSSQSCVSTLTHYSSELLLPRHQGL